MVCLKVGRAKDLVNIVVNGHEDHYTTIDFHKECLEQINLPTGIMETHTSCKLCGEKNSLTYSFRDQFRGGYLDLGDWIGVNRWSCENCGEYLSFDKKEYVKQNYSRCYFCHGILKKNALGNTVAQIFPDNFDFRVYDSELSKIRNSITYFTNSCGSSYGLNLAHVKCFTPERKKVIEQKMNEINEREERKKRQELGRKIELEKKSEKELEEKNSDIIVANAVIICFSALVLLSLLLTVGFIPTIIVMIIFALWVWLCGFNT
jgi:hypothetical protein